MKAIELALFGAFMILVLANLVLGHLAASYATRPSRGPFSMLRDMQEVYGAFWTGRLKDDSARNAILLQYGCVVLAFVVMGVLLYIQG